jgi:tripartite-type tricarboxylate transporter receptor subunit TctC
MLFRAFKSLMTAFLMFIALPITIKVASADDLNYPTRRITIVSPFAPGSAPDVSARLLAQLMFDAWGKPVVVENITGANGNLAMDHVARSEPDGYTLIMAPDTTICVNPHIYSTIKFNPRRDFVPVTSVVSNQFLLVVNPSLPARTLSEFVKVAQHANPALLYASIGVGSLHQLAMEMLKKRAGIELSHVPYRGGAATLNAAMTGEIQVMFTGAASAGLVQAGKLRALAISGSKRSEGFPDLPTVGETYPGFAIDAWIGLFAPAKTPKAVVEKLRIEAQKILLSDTFQSKINVSGSLVPLVLEPNEFLDLIDKDFEQYGALVKEIGIKLD